jgi:hypothetical protein
MSKRTEFATLTTVIDKDDDSLDRQRLEYRTIDLNNASREGYELVNTTTVEKKDRYVLIDTLAKTYEIDD